MRRFEVFQGSSKRHTQCLPTGAWSGTNADEHAQGRFAWKTKQFPPCTTHATKGYLHLKVLYFPWGWRTWKTHAFQLTGIFKMKCATLHELNWGFEEARKLGQWFEHSQTPESPQIPYKQKDIFEFGKSVKFNVKVTNRAYEEVTEKYSNPDKVRSNVID